MDHSSLMISRSHSVGLGVKNSEEKKVALISPSAVFPGRFNGLLEYLWGDGKMKKARQEYFVLLF